MVRKKKPILPASGAAFAVPLGDGRFAVCRVLLETTSERSTAWGRKYVLVANSNWIGNEVPHADDAVLRPILYLNHHSWQNRPSLLWVGDEPPDDLIPIGTIEPTTQEQAIPCQSFGHWNSLRIQPLAQWRWDNQRDAVLAEDALKQTNDAERRRHAQQERKLCLKRITLDELRDYRFFPNWKGYPAPKVIRASRKLMADTVNGLLELGPRASKKGRMAVLQQCIESFNELDAAMHFIETVEREDICREFEAIVHACGLGAHEDLADEWREW